MTREGDMSSGALANPTPSLFRFQWEKLQMTTSERRKIICSVTFHIIAITCVVWSLYVLIDRTAEEIKQGHDNGDVPWAPSWLWDWGGDGPTISYRRRAGFPSPICWNTDPPPFPSGTRGRWAAGVASLLTVHDSCICWLLATLTCKFQCVLPSVYPVGFSSGFWTMLRSA